MKRKNMPGCYCCQCEEIDVDELPTVTIAGYTQQGEWSGTECCKCLTFVADDPQQICSVSSVMATQEMTFGLEWEELGAETQDPRIVVDTPVPDPIPESVCCPGIPFLVATNSVQVKQKASYRIKADLYPDTITLCIFRLEVTCDDDPPALKWIVLSRYTYSGSVDVKADLYAKVTRTSTPSGADCFSVPSPDPCNDVCEKTIAVSCENDDAPFKCGLGGNPSFTRVKFYDELPTGNVVFDNDDTPENCTWDFCENPDDYYTSICWEVTESSDCLKNCLCGETLVDYPTELIGGEITQNCCDCPVIIGTGVPYMVYSSGACDAPSIQCFPCPEYDCGSFTRNRLNYPLIQPPATEECEDQYDADLDLWNAWFYGSQYDMCIDSFQNIRFPITQIEANCLTLTACGEDCDSDCCTLFECDDQVILCSHNYRLAGINVTDVSLVWDCQTIQGQSYCLSAPSWTVNFS